MNRGGEMTSAGSQTLQAALKAFRQSAGMDARVRADGLIHLGKGARRYQFVAEVKAVDRLATPSGIRREARTRSLLVAPYISREVAEHCRVLGLPFIDTAGNAYLEKPGLLVYIVGQPRPLGLRPESFRAVRSAGLQIVFAILCRPELAGESYRKIAAQAGVALGSVGPVVKDLEARGFLRRKKRQARLWNEERLVEEWVTHYPVTLRPKLNPRRFQAEPDRLRKVDLGRFGAYWSGEPAAEKLTGYLKPERYTIYTREPLARLVAAARMRADVQGNVEILDRFGEFASSDGANADVAPPLLVYADLVGMHDGRDREAARIVYEERIAPAFADGA